MRSASYGIGPVARAIFLGGCPKLCSLSSHIGAYPCPFAIVTQMLLKLSRERICRIAHEERFSTVCQYSTGRGPMFGTVPTAFDAPDKLRKGGLDQ